MTTIAAYLTHAFTCLLLLTSCVVGWHGLFAQCLGSGPVPSVAAPQLTELPIPSEYQAHAPAALLELASAALAPECVRWLETAIWQQLQLDELRSEMRGRYLTAPGGKMRLELQACGGGPQDRLLVVHDGSCCWRSTLAPGEQAVDGSAALPLGNLGQLLQSLSERLRQPTLRLVRWQERTLLEIKGGWVAVPNGAVPAAPLRQQVRHCRVYLDAQTLWPHRIEWWGAAAEAEPLVLLIATEYRTPRLNQPLSPERCATEFARPGAGS